jgi:hypothetical protein
VWTDEERQMAREQYEEIRHGRLDARLSAEVQQWLCFHKRPVEIRVLVSLMLRDYHYEEY